MPVVTASGGAAAYVENGAPMPVDPGLTVADADNATLASASVSIGANFAAGQDVLGFVNDGSTMGNIAASYDAANGALTLSSAGATATLAQWQGAPRAGPPPTTPAHPPPARPPPRLSLHHRSPHNARAPPHPPR